ncbi:AAA family ATPase [Flavobacterium agricola]|uniref:AAA family ATPase n=1 Tax=Flavobacterium agricola TaxID=2870839 RepID=A0ABY6M525_9FLAO|nr:AAA family ATPase [Flavobacterium agricola]UYW02601.1 AAA family ATPase [Flavobacterium agricola]
MTATDFYKILRSGFPFDATLHQDIFFNKVADFVLSTKIQDQIFVLKGFAGTGKTSVISTLVNNLAAVKWQYVLLAPTGRAAKVISNYANQSAYTIHKKIYFPKKQAGASMGFSMQPNKHKNTIFIVDEASMISDYSNDSQLYENGSLLDDLIMYVYSGQNCKLILVGDTAQLPPVGSVESPALNVDKLMRNYNMEVTHIELSEVMRQEVDSGILYNATELRELLHQNFWDHIDFKTKGFKDIVHLTDGYDIQDAIYSAYNDFSVEDTAFIVRSNKRANQYNQQIRMRILDRESEISPGDYMMVVKNNYFWLKDSKHTDFIANGDIIEVLQIYKTIELYGFKFARVKVRLIDYPNEPDFETMILLDTLYSESPSLTYQQQNQLYQEIMLDYENERAQYKKHQKMRENEYFNALQVKFSYAITCHKSQGGHWNTVFVEKPYLPDGISEAYIRWLYTAITRAKDKLYLIGFKDQTE